MLLVSHARGEGQCQISMHTSYQFLRGKDAEAQNEAVLTVTSTLFFFLLHFFFFIETLHVSHRPDYHGGAQHAGSLCNGGQQDNPG